MRLSLGNISLDRSDAVRASLWHLELYLCYNLAMQFSNRQLVLAGAGLAFGGAMVIWALDEKPPAKVARPVASGTPEPPSQGEKPVKTAIKKRGFHLRMRETGNSEGPIVPAGTKLTLLKETPVRRGRDTLWRVQTQRGTIGWTFISPDELV